MALTVCTRCQHHVHEGETCPFCGARPRRRIVGAVKAAVLTAAMPLGLAACYGVPPTEPPNPDEPTPSKVDPTTPAAEAPEGEDAPMPDGDAEAPAEDAATPEEG